MVPNPHIVWWMWLRDNASCAGCRFPSYPMVFYFERVGSEKWPESLKFHPLYPFPQQPGGRRERSLSPWANLTPRLFARIDFRVRWNEKVSVYSGALENHEMGEIETELFSIEAVRSARLCSNEAPSPLSEYCKSNSICVRYPLVICLLGDTNRLIASHIEYAVTIYCGQQIAKNPSISRMTPRLAVSWRDLSNEKYSPTSNKHEKLSVGLYIYIYMCIILNNRVSDIL